MTGNVFGWDLLLDLYECDLTRISSCEEIKRFAVAVCQRLRMKPFGEPIVEHFGHDKVETAGYSLVQLIETSAIVGHFSEYKRSAYLDVFSCRQFDCEAVTQFTQQFFGARRVVKRLIVRE